MPGAVEYPTIELLGASTIARPRPESSTSGKGLLRQASSTTMRARLGMVSSVPIRSTRRTELPSRSDSLEILRVDRQQVILALELHAVSGIIDHGDGIGSAIGNLGSEILHRLDHVAARQIGRRGDFKARRVEELRHRSRIVARIGEPRRDLIVRVADHERNPLLRPAAIERRR